jgi:hypothetical protein
MKYPSIRIEGSILSPDIFDRLEELPFQKPSDFGLETNTKVKDEIARAWADAQDYWRIFQRKLETLKKDSPATSETRSNWIVPLLSLLKYDLEFQKAGAELNGKTYAISHRVVNRAQTPLHIVGYRDKAGLDRKPENATLRMSAHAVIQEYINLHEQLFGLVTNGRVLRLLRDSSRLIKQSYLEFDLERIFTDGLFADFAVLYRLLHATRLPVSNENATDSVIEKYHQDSLDSGARIRNGLSRAVEQAIIAFGTGFLSHPANEELRAKVSSGKIDSVEYYKSLLRLIYRLLFLMVIEERDLVFPSGTALKFREIYSRFYSLQRLRKLSEERFLADKRQCDLWLGLLSTFELFEARGIGEKIGIKPLAGDLFKADAISPLSECKLGNDVLLYCLRSLGLYEHPETQQLIRVNYAALNVEEFGSVYEGLLEYEPSIQAGESSPYFAFKTGDERAATGSHYTPDDLVQPLIKHSLDYLIADKLKEKDRESALLSLRVADISCGSGHILLAAARRIATEVAIVRTGEEQPSPSAFRAAIRDVIRECIYGVDLNPLAVELCKVALWLEAHSPGEPLNFLDHHIKCGNSIVGYVRPEELDKGVPEEAFKTLPGDDKDVAALFRKQNKAERESKNQVTLELGSKVRSRIKTTYDKYTEIAKLPERTPAEIEKKKAKYLEYTQGQDAWSLYEVASIPIAQFYIPKTEENSERLITDGEFRKYWMGESRPQGQAPAMAVATAFRKGFFHWFIEFPEIAARGGFDCILGNPPYLGGTQLSGTYGYEFCNLVRYVYSPTGLSDLVVFFLRRIFSLLKPEGFTAFITTNSIRDGDVRRDGLEQVVAGGGTINFAVRGIRWSGQANLVVSLVGIHKGKWKGLCWLDGKSVSVISPFFEDSADQGEPSILNENTGLIYEGYKPLGSGFFLDQEKKKSFIDSDPRNAEVIFPFINGDEINSDPLQEPSREIIFFRNWSQSQAESYKAPFEHVSKVMPIERSSQNRQSNRERWWMFGEARPALTAKLRGLSRGFLIVRHTKYLTLSAYKPNALASEALKIFTSDRWDLFAILQSSTHEVWARKYSGALGQTLRYSPSKCFETFAFPSNALENVNEALANLGEKYHEHRRAIMLSLWIGLTDVYNLLHSQNVKSDINVYFQNRSSRDPKALRVASEHRSAVLKFSEEKALEAILILRALHVELDNAVLDVYGWSDLKLAHDFYEIETLPEGDRIRYTINPETRKELLKRLLALNHERAATEADKLSTSCSNEKLKKKKKSVSDIQTLPLFALSKEID